MQSSSSAHRRTRLLAQPSTVVALRHLLVVGVVLTLCLMSTGASADVVPTGSGQWPLSPRPHLVAGFAAPETQWSAGHRGVDLAGGPAQSVLAALAGRVSFAGRIAGTGVLVVDHGGFRTTYEPVSATVAVGDPVRAGTPIGVLELFGSHCFPAWCLHWGLIEGRDHYRDPLILVGATPVILLPLHTGASFRRTARLPPASTVMPPTSALMPPVPEPAPPGPFDHPLVLLPLAAGPSLYSG